MDSYGYLPAAAALSLLLVLSLLYSSLRRPAGQGSGSSSPPCLPCVPVLGSLPFLSTLDKFHLFLTTKSYRLGPVFSFYVFSQYTVVLNGYEALRDALVKRSIDYAGRGQLYSVDKVWTDPGRGILFSNYGQTYRRYRSHGLSVLKSFGYGQKTIMESKIYTEIEHLMTYIRSRDQEAWHPAHVLEFTAMNVIYNVMFSERFNYDEPTGQFLHEANKALADSCDVLYDLLPIVTYLPSVSRHLASVRRTYEKLLSVYEDKIEACRVAPVDRDNFIQEFLKISEREEFDRRELAVVLRDLILAGTETTSGQLNWALILMANHPHVQSRVQKEIDEQVPRDRLPSLDDKQRLAYVEATVLEVMRLKTAVPLAAPHVTLNDTQVLGYRVPANTTVIVNLWSAHMDARVWEEPERFDPQRFLDSDGRVHKRELVIPFSLGKRQCLGEVLARQEMFLIFSALMQQFKVLPPEGEEKVKDEYVFIRAMTARPHLMRIVPRESPLE